jgi:hypothetical protein
MIYPTFTQPPLDRFAGLSKDTLTACIEYLNTEILSEESEIWEVANHAYKIYSKACCLEQFVFGVKVKKLSRLQFQKLVDLVAQSVWAYGDKFHAHLFT